MSPTTASTAIKTLALITIVAGIAMLYLILGIGLPTAMRYSLSSALLLTIPMLAFAGYTLYLGYTLFSLLSRTAFERIWFGFTIFVVVIVGRQLPLFGACLAAIAIGIVSVFARHFVSNHLFPEHDHV